jgi:hypothetical protein
MDHVAAFDVAAGRGQDQQDRLVVDGRIAKQLGADRAGRLVVDFACQEDGARFEQRLLQLGRSSLFLLALGGVVLLILVEVEEVGAIRHGSSNWVVPAIGGGPGVRGQCPARRPAQGTLPRERSGRVNGRKSVLKVAL